jgi:adenine phosphoribosyltransferase
MDLKSKIVSISDWPEAGVVFRDITPLLQDKEAFKFAIDQMAEPYAAAPPDLVVGIDARGFILASALAYRLGAGLAIVRKKGKLPRKVVRQEYTLEYATNTIEMHEDAIRPGERVLMVDDVLATGGTMAAAVKMVEELGGQIAGVDFLIHLKALRGEEKINYPIRSLIQYE